MSQHKLTQPYEPNPVLRAIYNRLFESIDVDESWISSVQRLGQQGVVVHVLQTLNFVEFLVLDHVTKLHRLPRIRFVNDLGLWVLNPMGKGWLNALWPKRRPKPSEELRDALNLGGSAAMFLKRRANVVNVATSGALVRNTEPKEGDQLVQTLFEFQRQNDRPVILLPALFVWTQHPTRDELTARDLLIGPPEAPSATWTIARLLTDPGRVRLRGAEPLNLADFLRTNEQLPDKALIRRLVYSIMRRLGKERRGFIGPNVKAPDRVRDEIIRSPRMRDIIDDLAGGDPRQLDVFRRRAASMLLQMQAKPEYVTVRSLAKLVELFIHKIYAGLEITKGDGERLRRAARDGTLILLPSHKSHVDYMVVSYQFNQMGLPTPLVAAGDNLDFFPMGILSRQSGAFFIRRSFKGDRLYAAVVDAYVRRIIRDGFPIEVFLEGGRSRTGKLLEPKLGLLSMIVDATLAESQRRTYFVPMSIGYERIVETDSYGLEMTGGEKHKENAVGLLRTRRIFKHRYGRINMQVGEIVTLDKWSVETGLTAGEPLRPAKRRALVSRLARHVMDEINRVTAVTPGALTALVLLSHSHRGLSHELVVHRATALLILLRRAGVRTVEATATPAGTLRPSAIREALQLFADGEIVEIHATSESDAAREQRRRGRLQAGPGSFYVVPDSKRLALDTSKNIIIHFFVSRALFALAWLAGMIAENSVVAVHDRFCELRQLFLHEFRLGTKDEADQAFEQTLTEFSELGLIIRDEDKLTLGDPQSDLPAEKWLMLLSEILVNYLEGYRVAARTVSLVIEQSLPMKEFFKRALATGNRMFFAGEIMRREAITKPILQNALTTFADQRLVDLRGEKVKAVDAGATQTAILALEARLVLYLQGARP
jgi:glycerol-3-phosphate O-acyltransferase